MVPDVDVDVLVVGYGPVGAAITALLGGYGARVLAVDKLRDVVMAPRAIALDSDGLRILQMVGLTDDAFAKVVIPEVRMLCPHVGEFARVDTSGTVDGHPKLVTFYQPELERALRAHAERQASVEVRLGVELVWFEDRGDVVDAHLRARNGRETIVRARFLVGADGASSRVRAALGVDFEGATYAADWLIVDAVGVPHEIDHVEFLCDPDRPTPHMVAPGGRTRWEFMLKPGETRERMEDDATIRSLLAPWADAHEIVIERKDVYRFHARVCSRFSSERVFLVGDAAHVTPPFTGQGLVAGLRDAANLGWKLAWVVHGRATAAILESYDRERRPHVTKMVALAKLMGRIVVPQDRVHAVLIHGGVRMVRRLPPVRRYIDRIGMKPRNAFDEGLFARGRGRRGAWMPQVTLGPSRSDDLLGAALTLVGVGVDPERSLTETTARRWAVAGGHTLQLPAGAMRAWCPAGWCAVVRPDRTVMHDGPVAKVEPMVTEALEMLSRAA